MASTFTVGTVLSLVKKKIVDETNVDYSQIELLTLYNITNREIVKLMPRAYTKLNTLLLAVGNKQKIPSPGMVIIEVLRNMGTDGSTPGRTVRETTMEIMKKFVPFFSTHVALTDSSIWDWWPVPQEPESFFVHPQSDGSGYVELEYSAPPTDVVYDAGGIYLTTTIALSDIYLTAIIDGMMFQAYDDDTDIPGNTPRSGVYYARFLQDLGISTGGQ